MRVRLYIPVNACKGSIRRHRAVGMKEEEDSA